MVVKEEGKEMVLRLMEKEINEMKMVLAEKEMEMVLTEKVNYLSLQEQLDCLIARLIVSSSP